MLGLGLGLGRHRGTGRAWIMPGAALDLDFVNNKSWVRGSGAGDASSPLTVSRASVGYVDSAAGVWSQVASNTLRRSDKGVLVEESRTNSIRNNSMQGAVAGTPGTLPTNWSYSGEDTGLTTSVVGVGTENGVEYVDIRWQGTTNGTNRNFWFEANQTIAALAGQTWTGSVFFSIISGSVANFSALYLRVWEYNGNTALGFGSTDITTATSALTRYTHSRTLTEDTTNYTRLAVNATFTSGVAIDITFRVGWPQLELGAFATSPIRTTSAAATRAADVVNMSTGSWFNASEGSLYVEYVAPAGVTGTNYPALAALYQTSANNAQNTIRMLYATATRIPAFLVRASNVDQASLIGSSTTGGNSYKAIGAYKASDFAACYDGGTVSTDTSGSVPTGLDKMDIGYNSAVGPLINSYIKRIAYFPTRLSNAELQALTS